MALQVDLLLDRARLITMDDGRPGPLSGVGQQRLGLIEDGAVAVLHGRVAALGPRDAVLRQVEPIHTFDAEGAAVLPGLVDCHTHPLWAGSRVDEFERRLAGATYLEIMDAGGGIASTVRATREASDSELLELLLHRLDQFLVLGTTTLEAKTGYGLAAAEELRQLRLLRRAEEDHPVRLAITFLGAHALPEEMAGAPEAYVDSVIDEMLPAVAAGHEDVACDVFCDRGAFSLAQTERILRAATAMGMRIKVHSDEFDNLGCTELAASLGALSADHLVATRPDQMEALARSGTVAVLLPGTTFGLASTHYADAREFVRRNVPVALATDYNPGTCPSESLPFVVALAVRYMHLSPAEAVAAVTRNGAAAVGRDNKAGRLAVGRPADLVLLEGDDYRDLAYRFGSSPVSGVMVEGQWLYGPGSATITSSRSRSPRPWRRPPAGR